MKKSCLYFLLFFWVFAIVAPAIITIIGDNTVIIVSNLNEEENQNSVNKYVAEKHILYNNTEDIFSSLVNNKKVAHSRYLLGSSNYILDINLPPPEFLS
ncbi:hypothetical protein DHD32_06690 [Arenibacter sp. TNZ]|jgi:predicted PurR-regulated permease PerM|uniref:hypothetical protein n=1 Tax=Arenibacter TaxID=178469 RepID=UPI000CD3CB91|nr:MULTISPECIES: hypothetical protein [Arenibacter]MCM4171159.1 hypothetical protein [Arenibacter sp. TNZ]